MMDTFAKLYGIQQEQQLMPYKMADLASETNDNNARGNYFGAEASSMPDKNEALRERSMDHMMNAAYLGKALGIDPQALFTAMETGNFQGIMSSGQTPPPPGNYADLMPGMPTTQNQPQVGMPNGQQPPMASFLTPQGLPMNIPASVANPPGNNFVTPFLAQRNQGKMQRTY